LADAPFDEVRDMPVIHVDIKATQTGSEDARVERPRLDDQQLIFLHALLPLFAERLLRL
jgi:hypothetical protein